MTLLLRFLRFFCTVAAMAAALLQATSAVSRPTAAADGKTPGWHIRRTRRPAWLKRTRSTPSSVKILFRQQQPTERCACLAGCEARLLLTSLSVASPTQPCAHADARDNDKAHRRPRCRYPSAAEAREFHRYTAPSSVETHGGEAGPHKRRLGCAAVEQAVQHERAHEDEHPHTRHQTLIDFCSTFSHGAHMPVMMC